MGELEWVQLEAPAWAGVVQAIKQLDLPHLVPSGFMGSIVRDAVVSCSSGKTECEFVLMPMGAMGAERASQ